ncbi:hypothetical protein HHK36_007194 [Tetracentron sinense]|uniref:Uncharacterized protein n=1 Tax=Tetracentron sinense TaxID=13715 RepID=A0A834ZMX9_TETSI|nr:hypothetical protein HHK36_007194 [Tetracentron sinense]
MCYLGRKMGNQSTACYFIVNSYGKFSAMGFVFLALNGVPKTIMESIDDCRLVYGSFWEPPIHCLEYDPTKETNNRIFKGFSSLEEKAMTSIKELLVSKFQQHIDVLEMVLMEDYIDFNHTRSETKSSITVQYNIQLSEERERERDVLADERAVEKIDAVKLREDADDEKRWERVPVSTLKLAKNPEVAIYLLYKDYQTDHKFNLTTYTSTGIAITSSGTKKGDLFLADVNTQLKNKNITTDVKVDTNSNLSAIITIDEPAPGLKTIFSFIVPDQRSGKVELQYLHDYAGISTSIGLTANPIVNFSGVIGSNIVSVGTDLSFDTATGNFTKCNTGLSFSKADLIASMTLNDKGDTLNASYYHTVSPLTNTTVGAELTHSFSSNENTLTIGTQHALDPLTLVKARVNNYGKASALIQHEWRPKSLFTISGEVDTRAIEKSAKVGLALVLKP